MTFPLLSVITFLPLLGAVVVLLLPNEATKKPIALVWTVATFLISTVLWINWEPGQAGMQFADHGCLQQEHQRQIGADILLYIEITVIDGNRHEQRGQ